MGGAYGEWSWSNTARSGLSGSPPASHGGAENPREYLDSPLDGNTLNPAKDLCRVLGVLGPPSLLGVGIA